MREKSRSLPGRERPGFRVLLLLFVGMAVGGGCEPSGALLDSEGPGPTPRPPLVSDDDDLEEEDRSDEVFARPMLEIDVDIDPMSWETLRVQRKTRHSAFGRTDCRAVQVPNPYTWFEATVTIDGEVLEGVGVRKKGHLGSQSTEHPSIKLKFDEFNEGGRYRTVKRLALNNSKSDGSYLKMCLTNEAFAAAGMPAPRCTHGFLRVNGEPMGVVVVSEEIKKPFLRRWFASDEGTLLEGTATDWRQGFYGGLEQETNVGEVDISSTLDAIYELVEFAEDEDFLAALPAYFDMDALYRFWAMESIVRHRDGYSGNANNYFLYADPDRDDRFVFLVWGADSALRTETRASVPDSVLAFGKLAFRLYAIPEARAAFHAAQASILEEDWAPEAMVARADAAELLLADWVRPDLSGAFPGQVQAVRDMILGQRDRIEAELEGGTSPEWVAGLRTSPCRTPLDTVSGTFATTWDTLGSAWYRHGAATVVQAGQSLDLRRSAARAGLQNGSPRVQVRVETEDDLRYTFNFPLPANRWFSDYTVPGRHFLGNPPVNGSVAVYDLAAGTAIGTFDVAEGEWSVDVFERSVGGRIQGAFDATLWLRP